MLCALGVGMILAACSVAPGQQAKQSEATSSTTKEEAKALLDKGVAAYQQQNYTEAMTIFTQASAAGHMKAPRYIGLMYLNGYGVQKNAKRAVAEFIKAAEQGDITSQYWLAYCYEQGMGVAQSKDKALKWYARSAQRGDIIAAPAMTALGRLAEEDNLQEAIDWYQKAAAVGGKEAQDALVRLGIIHK